MRTGRRPLARMVILSLCAMAMLRNTSFPLAGIQVTATDPEKTAIERQTRRLLMVKVGGVYHEPSLETQREVRDALMAIVRRSASARAKVIEGLMELFESGIAKSRPMEDPACYTAARLLGDLHADQAIDLLIRYVDYNNGMIGLSLSHFPAAFALRQIGQPAVAKLIEALHRERRSQDVDFRRTNLIRVLGEISGTAADKALAEVPINFDTNSSIVFYVKRARDRMLAR